MKELCGPDYLTDKRDYFPSELLGDLPSNASKYVFKNWKNPAAQKIVWMGERYGFRDDSSVAQPTWMHNILHTPGEDGLKNALGTTLLFKLLGEDEFAPSICNKNWTHFINHDIQNQLSDILALFMHVSRENRVLKYKLDMPTEKK